MVSASFLLVPACPSVLAWLLPCDSPPATGWAHVWGSCLRHGHSSGNGWAAQAGGEARGGLLG